MLVFLIFFFCSSHSLREGRKSREESFVSGLTGPTGYHENEDRAHAGKEARTNDEPNRLPLIHLRIDPFPIWIQIHFRVDQMFAKLTSKGIHDLAFLSNVFRMTLKEVWDMARAGSPYVCIAGPNADPRCGALKPFLITKKNSWIFIFYLTFKCF